METNKLIEGYLTDSLQEDEKKAFLDQASSSEEFREELDQAERAYAASWLPRFEDEKADVRPRGSVTRFPAWARIAVAAAIAAVCTLGGVLIRGRVDRKAIAQAALSGETRITVPDGSRMKIALPDGSEVWLNASSSLSYQGNFSASRQVEISGEGYFNVRHDPLHPFIVKTDIMDVTVTGTVFNIRRYDDEPTAEVSLIDGSVEVNPANSSVKKVLSPDNKAVVDAETGIITVEGVDAVTSALWITGRLHFVDAPVSKMLSEIARVKGVEFSYSPSILSGERFTGNIRTSLSVDEILRCIDVDNKLEWTIDGDIVEIKMK